MEQRRIAGQTTLHLTLHRLNTSDYGSAYPCHFESNNTIARAINEFSPTVALSAGCLTALQAESKKLAAKHTASYSGNKDEALVEAVDTNALIGAATTIRQSIKAVFTFVGGVEEVRGRTGSAVVLS
jgi:hypothetical protein